MASRSLAKRVTYKLTHIAARLAAVSLFKVRVHGRENVPADGGVLVCSNHQSVLDPVVVGLAIDRRMNYVARESLFRNPLFGWLIRWYDAIPIQRDGMGLSGIKETLKRVRRGEMVLLFPEGTRTLNGWVQPLKPGFCAIARRGKVPLLPVAMDGPHQIWPRGRKLPRPGAIQIWIGKPLELADYNSMSDETLIAELSQRITSCHATARAARELQIGNKTHNRTT